MLGSRLKCLMNVIRQVIQNLEMKQNDYSMPFPSHVRALSKKSHCSVLSQQAAGGAGWGRAIKEEGEVQGSPKSFREDPGCHIERSSQGMHRASSLEVGDSIEHGGHASGRSGVRRLEGWG